MKVFCMRISCVHNDCIDAWKGVCTRKEIFIGEYRFPNRKMTIKCTDYKSNTK